MPRYWIRCATVSSRTAGRRPPAHGRAVWRFARGAGLAGVLLVAVGCGPSAERVVLVTVDTLRADHVGAYGDERARTPTLDRLAREGVRFDHAVAPTPITLPSHASLMTALDPPRHGVRHNATFRLGEEVPTLAERAREAGLATAAFVGAAVLDRRFGLARGFDTYDDRMGPRHAAGADGFAERRAAAVMDAVLAWLETAPDRFLLWVHVYDPHADYAPPEGFLAAFPDDPYAGEIAYVDAQLARLLGGVEARWPAGTLVVVTADHGESLGEHGELTHSLTLYEATQRVPLLLHGPGVPGGRVVEDLARLVDVAPTVLAALGAPPLGDVDGRVLPPFGRAPDSAAQEAYLETLATQLDFGWSPLLGLRTPRFKYIRAPRPELYDLEADPEELHDLAAVQPERVAELDARLEARLPRGAGASERLALDPAERERLERLGYVLAGHGGAPRGDLGRVGGIDPKDALPAVARMHEAVRLLRSGHVAEARRMLDAIEGGGFLVDGYRSEAARAAGDPVAAERHARAALSSAPENPLGWLLLGLALEEQGRLDDAEAAYRRALALDPDRLEAHLGLGRLAEVRGRRQQAEQHYREALERQPGHAEARWRLAALRIEAGDEAGARALLAELPPAALDEADAAVRLARAEAWAGRLDAARAWLRRAGDDPRAAAARAEIEAGGAAR